MLLVVGVTACSLPWHRGAGELAYRKGTQKTLIGLCVMMFCGFCCTVFVPETKGKTLEEVHALAEASVSDGG